MAPSKGITHAGPVCVHAQVVARPTVRLQGLPVWSDLAGLSAPADSDRSIRAIDVDS